MGSLEPFKPYSRGLRHCADSLGFSSSIRVQVLPLCGVVIVEQVGVSSTSQFSESVGRTLRGVCVWMILG